MPKLISTTMAVHRHRQDNGTWCGRACVQMVISALTQTGPATAKVPVTQDALRLREPDKETVPGASDPPIWYTHPDELVELLRKAPELSPGVRERWRIANHGTIEDLLDDLIKALDRGMPSVMNVFDNDHWVVLIRAEIGEKGLEAVHYLDPLQVTGTTPQHTYIDACSNTFEGECCAPADRMTRRKLGSANVEIGPVPPPAGLTDYDGRFVAVIHGPSRVRLFLNRLFAGTRSKIPIAPLSPRPALPGETHAALSELAWRATEWTVPALNPLLESKPLLVDRLVRDLDGSAETYRLVGLWSERLDYGLVGAFESDTYTVEHFRFTSSPDIFRVLSQTQDDQADLWMTRRWLPSLSSPYHPFVRQRSALTGGPIREAAVFTRLIDGFVLTIDPHGRVR